MGTAFRQQYQSHTAETHKHIPPALEYCFYDILVGFVGRPERVGPEHAS